MEKAYLQIIPFVAIYGIQFFLVSWVRCMEMVRETTYTRKHYYISLIPAFGVLYGVIFAVISMFKEATSKP